MKTSSSRLRSPIFPAPAYARVRSLSRRSAWRIAGSRIGSAAFVPLALKIMHSDSSSEEDEPLSKRMKPAAAAPKPTPTTEKVESIEFADLILAEHAAFDALKAARLRVWKEALIEKPAAKAFHIASDRQLCQMVRHVPTHLDELRQLGGFGVARVEEHGSWLLASLQPFVNELRAAHAELQTLSAEALLAAKQDAAAHRATAVAKSKEEAKAEAKQERKAARQAQKQALDEAASARQAEKRAEFQRLSGREYLNVPFLEKDVAKNLGARWDAEAKQWWISTP